MLTPSSSAVVVASPVIWPVATAISSARRSSARYPERYAATLAVRSAAPASASARLAPSATASAPRLDRTNASAGTFPPTRSASSPAASAVAVRRTGAPGLAAERRERWLPQPEGQRAARR